MTRRMDSTTGFNNDNDLYDDSIGYDDEVAYVPPRNLSVEERRQALTLYKLFNGLWGLCIVRGAPGTGKDTFLNWFLSQAKRYYPGKRILRDEKPRRLFGHYDGMFNEARIKDDLDALRKSASGADKKEIDNILSANADAWAKSDRANALLSNSIVGLTEFWKYVYNRESLNPMNKTMGGIHKMKRHFPTLIIGCTQLVSDLDKNTCKPFIDWEVICTRSRVDTTRYTFLLEKVTYDKRRDVLIATSRPFPIYVDAGKPRSYLGDGKIKLKRPDYQPETEEENIVLTCIKAGINTYDDLVDYIENYGDMSEYEILRTLKDLALNLEEKEGKRPKYVIDYPCDYKLFNSKSSPNLKTNIKVGD